MLINSAQLSGLYSHPWPLLMNIDSDLSGPKSRGRRAMVSGAGKQNSQSVNMARPGRVCVFICFSPEWSIITWIKRKADSCGEGQQAAFSATEDTKEVGGFVHWLYIFQLISYLICHRWKRIHWQFLHVSSQIQNEMSDPRWKSNSKCEVYYARKYSNVISEISHSGGVFVCPWSLFQSHLWTDMLKLTTTC